jgi:hypothetical protein
MVKWTSRLRELDLEGKVDAVHKGVVNRVFDSVVYGSLESGSPGQPEDLRQGQWQVTDEGENQTLIWTDDPSARSVEDGISYLHGGVPITLNSPIGGSHSVALTDQNGDRIIEKEVQRVFGRAR